MTAVQAGALHVALAPPTISVKRIHLRWRGDMTDARLILGDAWERGYGDLEWRSWIPDRVMPWYFVTYDGSLTHAYGVRTGARALCFWQVDPLGISLWVDVRSGAAGVQLGERTLDVCDVVCRAGRADESAFAALHAFCRQIRPLQAPADAPDGWRLTRERAVLDPSLPDVLQKVRDDITRLRQWGFELIKHDYTTFDVFGRWGFQMGSALTRDGWTFASGSNRTTAEIIDALYGTIREAAGESLLIGCNTLSHLSAGHFEICRVGDDTSGTEWARTRKMGVNTLAFRGAQHGAGYVCDADCVGITSAVPWTLNRQWLDLLARSGTMLFVSLAPDALGALTRRDLRAALALAATHQPLAEPLDWQRTVYPEHWRLMGHDRRFEWVGADGTEPPSALGN